MLKRYNVDLQTLWTGERYLGVHEDTNGPYVRFEDVDPLLAKLAVVLRLVTLTYCPDTCGVADCAHPGCAIKRLAMKILADYDARGQS